MTVTARRVYDDPVSGEGLRVLVDRLWPRGVAKAKVDVWLKDVAPSTELRKWFSHDDVKWSEFEQRYKKELAGNEGAVAELEELARDGDIVLLYATRAEQHHALVLLDLLA